MEIPTKAERFKEAHEMFSVKYAQTLVIVYRSCVFLSNH